MEKLLHERLREFCEACPDGSIEDYVNAKTFRTVDVISAIADEIERYYIPRPRFEDGEPVKFGEEVGDASLIEGVPIDGICLYANGRYQLHGGDASVYYADGQPIKRPTPKVYDADGMETNRGDAVYSIKGSDRLTVKEICGGCIKVNENILSYPLSEITHERPVFDAGGVRICKGDEGWCTTNGAPCKVVGDDKRSGDLYVEWTDSEYINSWIKADYFTNREPDSLEKLRDEMRAYADGSVSCIEDDLHMFADRLTALIERGAE